MDVEAQVRHPNGTVLTVTGVTFEDPVVDVDMEVLNGYALEVYVHIQNWDELDGFDISDEADRTDGPGFVVSDLPVSP